MKRIIYTIALIISPLLAFAQSDTLLGSIFRENITECYGKRKNANGILFLHVFKELQYNATWFGRKLIKTDLPLQLRKNVISACASANYYFVIYESKSSYNRLVILDKNFNLIYHLWAPNAGASDDILKLFESGQLNKVPD